MRILKLCNKYLLVMLYIVMLVVMLLYSLVSFAGDRILRATGALYTYTVEAEELTFIDIVSDENGVLSSTSNDPQIILPSTNTLLASLTMNLRYTSESGEIVTYFTTDRSPEFSSSNRVFGSIEDDGIVFNFGLVSVNSLRIDPTNYIVEIGKLEHIIVNPQRDFIEFFLIDSTSIYFFITVPLLLWAVIVGLKLAVADKIKMQKGVKNE